MLVTASPALACPPGARCITNVPQRDEVTSPKQPRAISLRIDGAPDRPPWRFRVATKKSEPARLPRMWDQIRRVADRMPGYRSESVKFGLSPVVVISKAFETLPCVGVFGRF